MLKIANFFWLLEEIFTVMVVNLHFQFAKQESNTFQLELEMPGNGRLHVGDGIWLNDKARRKIRRKMVL